MIKKKIEKIVRYIFFISLIFFVLGICAFLFGAKQMGYLQARYDVMRGHYKIKGYGLGPFYSYGENEDVLKSHGIELVAVADCVVNDSIIENVAAYNAVMKNEIRDKFGIDIDKLKK